MHLTCYDVIVVMQPSHHELASERTDGEIWSTYSQSKHLLVVLFYFVFIGL